MRKKIAIMVIISVFLMLVLTSCGDIKRPEIVGVTSGGAFIGEWVSPDGVHYWIYDGKGIAPRYDSNGNLILDNLEEFNR